MKKIGILGGLSPESTVTYYEYITREYAKRFGDYGFPEIIIYSVKFQDFIELFCQGDWDRVADEAVKRMKCLHKAGADFGLMATNTLHRVFDQVQKQSPIPLISIVESTIEAIKAEKMQTVGLLGTVSTMREGFYVDQLAREGIRAYVPSLEEQDKIQEIIFSELTVGKVTDESKQFFLRTVKSLQEQGAQGVILGCTEIPLVLSQQDCTLKLFDSTRLHAESALRVSLE